jgi:hypothetical protein
MVACCFTLVEEAPSLNKFEHIGNATVVANDRLS